MKRIILITIAILISSLAASAQDSGPTLNKKNLVVKEWNSDAKGEARSIDHTTIYSPEGKKIEETEFDTRGKQKWRKRYEWGENGKMTRELLYDEHNRLVNYKKFDYNEFGKKKVQYTYDPKGKLISVKTFEYLAQDA